MAPIRFTNSIDILTIPSKSYMTDTLKRHKREKQHANKIQLVKEPSLILNILTKVAKQKGEELALISPWQGRLNWRQLVQSLEETIAKLDLVGLKPGERIVSVLENGPETALITLALICNYCAAPVKPQSPFKEIKKLVARLGASTLLIDSQYKDLDMSEIEDMGVNVIRATSNDLRMGEIHFTTISQNQTQKRNAGLSTCQASNIVLLLSTSGTTGTPKIVGLTEQSIVENCRNLAKCYKLKPSDRRLNISPLCYIHGIVGGILAPLLSGGSTICTKGFEAKSFQKLLLEYRPTWYAAVPTVHQAILDELESKQDKLHGTSLRLIRSGSAPLSSKLQERIEKYFGVPVIEGYGMTETCGQISCNPLPPVMRKLGSAGLSTGPEVAIIDSSGASVPFNTVGEIVVKGKTVIKTYDGEGPNCNSFWGEWLRTGDIGRIDEDGFIWIEGRVKEMINRGGVKIFPGKIDEVLSRYPGIRDALAFAIPHETLGEDVGAAIIMQEEAEVINESDLRDFIMNELPLDYTPSAIIKVKSFPKGPTGKYLRDAIAREYQYSVAASRNQYVAPKSELEISLHTIWSQVLGRSNFSIDDNFFLLGGNSLSAAQISVKVQNELNSNLTVRDIFRFPTVGEQSNYLLPNKTSTQNQAATERSKHRVLVELQPTGDLHPLYVVHGIAGDVAHYIDLSQSLFSIRPVYGVQAPNYSHELATISMEELCSIYAEAIIDQNGTKPIHLFGTCAGGWYALALAEAIKVRGGQVGAVIVEDTSVNRRTPLHLKLLVAAIELEDRAKVHFVSLRQSPSLMLSSRHIFGRFIALKRRLLKYRLVGSLSHRSEAIYSSLSEELTNDASAEVKASCQQDYPANFFRNLVHAYRPQRPDFAIHLITTQAGAKSLRHLWRFIAKGDLHIHLLTKNQSEIQYEESKALRINEILQGI